MQNEPKDQPINPPMVKTMVGEIAAMEYAGQVKAIAAVVIDHDGDVRTLCVFGDGFRIPMIAGVGILQHQLINDVKPVNKARNI